MWIIYLQLNEPQKQLPIPFSVPYRFESQHHHISQFSTFLRFLSTHLYILEYISSCYLEMEIPSIKDMYEKKLPGLKKAMRREEKDRQDVTRSGEVIGMMKDE